MLENQNALEWFDFIITIALDSSQSEVDILTQMQYENIIQKANEKKRHYISFLKQQTLSLPRKRKAQQLIRYHHSSLLILLDQVAQTSLHPDPRKVQTTNVLQITSKCIYEILTFIEHAFRQHLDSDEKVPDAYFRLFTIERQDNIKYITEGLLKRNVDLNLIDLLAAPEMDAARRPANFRTIFYQRELIAGLRRLLTEESQLKIQDALVEHLIYLNFNSRPFMNYYTRTLVSQINSVEPISEKISELLLRHKEFNQMHSKPGVGLSTSDSNVKKVISNWFTQEISYLKANSSRDLAPLENLTHKKSAPKEEPVKIMVLLSVDQIGLFLRALDSLRILKARSLNAVFRTITPYLSTPNKTEISWDSMRSKSYTFEENDKKTVIKVLESVISWINEY